MNEFVNNSLSNEQLAIKGEIKSLLPVKRKHMLVIFVHGTILPLPNLSAMHDWVNGVIESNYSPYISCLRDKGMWPHQPIGPLGFHKVVPSWSSNATGAQLFGWLLQEMYNLLPDNEQATIYPYTFGWDGELSLKSRKIQAKNLLSSIENLIKSHRRKHQFDFIETMILAHSHGGNVALHMADNVVEKPTVQIDHLFLFGTPIHGETQLNAKTSLFKNVYNIHSSGDAVQVGDIVSTKRHIWGRVFKHPYVVDAPNIKQILVQVGSYNPTHTELWFFERPEVLFFRKKFPTAPIPVAAFVPLILREIKKTKDKDHFLKLTLNVSPSILQITLVPFQDYWKNKLVKNHQYQSTMDYSAIYSAISSFK